MTFDAATVQNAVASRSMSSADRARNYLDQTRKERSLQRSSTRTLSRRVSSNNLARELTHVEKDKFRRECREMTQDQVILV